MKNKKITKYEEGGLVTVLVIGYSLRLPPPLRGLNNGILILATTFSLQVSS